MIMDVNPTVQAAASLGLEQIGIVLTLFRDADWIGELFINLTQTKKTLRLRSSPHFQTPKAPPPAGRTSVFTSRERWPTPFP
jgi:hypothetical protein